LIPLLWNLDAAEKNASAIKYSNVQ